MHLGSGIAPPVVNWHSAYFAPNVADLPRRLCTQTSIRPVGTQAVAKLLCNRMAGGSALVSRTGSPPHTFSFSGPVRFPPSSHLGDNQISPLTKRESWHLSVLYWHRAGYKRVPLLRSVCLPELTLPGTPR